MDHFDRAQLKSIFKDVGQVAYLKLLSMRPAIPEYDGTSPYQEIPYGFSLSRDEDTTSSLFGHESNPAPGLSEELIAKLDKPRKFIQGF